MRLTNNIRRIIMSNALKLLSEDKKKLKEEEHFLALEILESIPNYLNACELLGTWIVSNNQIFIKLEGQRIETLFFLENRYPTHEKTISIPKDSRFNDRIERLKVKKSMLIDREKDIIKEVQIVFSKSNTIKQLLEIWPNAKELIPTNFNPPTEKDIDISKLNSLLGEVKND
jgi:uncharacterized protein (UPF0335 family)